MAKNSKNIETVVIDIKSRRTYFGPALLSKSRDRKLIASEIAVGHIFENKRNIKFIVTEVTPFMVALTEIDKNGTQLDSTRKFEKTSLAGLIVNNHLANTDITRREVFADIAKVVENNRLLRG